MKIVDSRKAKVSKKAYYKALFSLVSALAFVTPAASVTAFATESSEEVLFEDTTDDQTVEQVDSNDVVEDNTVVSDGDNQTQEETQQDTQEQTQQQTNNGGECITEDYGYNEEAGKNWDPSIQTETEKKGLTPSTPSTPPSTPSTPPTDSNTPSTPSTPSTPVEETVVTETPRVTPKTGDLSGKQIALLLASVGLVSLGGASLGYVHASNKIKSKKRK